MKKAFYLFLTCYCCITVRTMAQTTSYVWNKKACLPAAGRNVSAEFSLGNNGYSVAGSFATGPIAEVWEYHQPTNSWTQKNNYGGGVMSAPSAFVIDSTVYVGLGFDGTNYHTDFWKYNQNNDTWTQIAPFPGAPRYTAMSFSANGKGYVGCGKGSEQYNDFYAYDPVSNTWTAIASFPGAARQSGFGASVNNIGYVGMGSGGGVYYNDLYSYNPASNTWTTQASYPAVGAEGVACFVINNVIYVAGGATGGTNLTSACYGYDPASNSWTQQESWGCLIPSLGGWEGFTINGQGYFANANTFSTRYNELLEFGPDDTTFTTRIHVLGNDTSYCGTFSRVLSTGNSCTQWSDGSTAATLTVTTPGTYWARISDSCGMSSDTIHISQLTSTSVSISASGPVTFCQGGSVTLTANSVPGTTYNWTGGATTQSIVVISSGSYTVTASLSGGCSAASNAEVVTVISLPVPVINANGPTTFCQGGSVTLDAGEGYTSYHWSNGATSETITVTASGSFSCNVTATGGCAGTSNTVTVTANNNPSPTITAGGPTTFCQGGSVILDAGEGYTAYHWSNGATSETITVTASGSFSCNVTATGGCAGTSNTVTVTANNNPSPTITAGGPTTFCQGGSVILDAGEGYTAYHWSNGATSETITVTASGSFSCNVTATGGCAGTSNTVTVTANNNPSPTITAGGPTTFCQGGSVILDAGEGYTAYHWSNGATSETITVTASGSFSCNVTATGGCAGTSNTVTVTANNNPSPTITAGGPTTFCQGGSVILDAGEGYTAYHWSNGATSETITVTASGSFSCNVTATGGCSGNSNTIVVTVNSDPSPIIKTSGPTTFCQGGSVVLDAGAGYTAYLWSNGATTQTITVTASGSYSCDVTETGICSGNSNTIVVTINSNPAPTVTPAGPVIICQGTTATLNAGAGYTSYAWSNSATTQTTSVTTAGNYTCTVTLDGCSGSSNTVVVSLNTTPPDAVCKNATVTLTNGTASITASTVDGGSAASCGIAKETVLPSTFTFADTGANTVVLTVTDSSGHSSTCDAIVTVLNSGSCTPFTCSITSEPEACGHKINGRPDIIYLGYGPQSTKLSVSVTGSGPYTFAWTPSANLSCSNCSDPIFTPTTGGLYTFEVTVLSGAGGTCTSTCSITICVLDIRVPHCGGCGGWGNCGFGYGCGFGGNCDNQIYICHYLPGCHAFYQTIAINANDAESYLRCHPSDHLGGCDQSCDRNKMDDDSAGKQDGNVAQLIPVSENGSGFDLLVYPNPFINQFHLRINSMSTEQINVTMIDITGRTIIQQNAVESNSDILLGENLAKGLYFVEVVQGSESKVIKITKAE